MKKLNYYLKIFQLIRLIEKDNYLMNKCYRVGDLVDELIGSVGSKNDAPTTILKHPDMRQYIWNWKNEYHILKLDYQYQFNGVVTYQHNPNESAVTNLDWAKNPSKNSTLTNL